MKFLTHSDEISNQTKETQKITNNITNTYVSPNTFSVSYQSDLLFLMLWEHIKCNFVVSL